jgi:hypothetical protein
MTKIDRVLNKLSELYEFNRKLKAYRIEEKASEKAQRTAEGEADGRREKTRRHGRPA